MSAVCSPVDDSAVNTLSTDTLPARDVLINNRYLLDAGDQLQVEVFNAPDYSGEFMVLAGGVLSVPLAGEISVQGLTLTQASEEIAAQLRQYIRRPRVTVSLLSARPLQVAIAGEVNRPGAYTLTSDEEGVAPTLTQAISLAGGITQLADIRRIRLWRQISRLAQLPAQKTETVMDVDLWQLLEQGQLNADVRLQHGDRIVIARATDLSSEDLGALASASFSPDTMSVNVVGEVVNPGAIALPPNAPLNQALLTAGGFNRRARRSHVSLIRLNSNGTVTQQDISVDFEAGVDPDNNPSLRPNDTIVVGTNGLSQVTDVLGSVLSPLNSGFNLLRLFND